MALSRNDAKLEAMTRVDHFHPAVRTWFERKFRAPTDAQSLGWPEITSGRDTLISALTGSGKTLAAFLVSIDRLIREAEKQPLTDEVNVLYISPLKALSNDIRRNLEDPLAEIEQVAIELGYPSHGIRTAVRTGDTTQAERQAIVKNPPHILITTPESLYLMLTAERSREILRTIKTVIVDEIHALLRDKRGSHLALTLARVDHICEQRPARIGLSATIKPVEEAARFLVGADRTKSAVDATTPLPARPEVSKDRGELPRPATDPALGTQHSALGTPDCTIVNTGHQRDLEIEIEIPPTDLEAVASGEQWRDMYDRLADLIKQHRTTLIFVNTRRLAERAAFALAERIGEEHVGAHHGSLSKERRLNFEQRLKAGEMKALVATASLELGIDIGTIDLVCQLESPRSMTTFLQRVGRSGHALGLTPKGRLFPTTRDELVECAALVRAVKAGRLDRLYPPVAPLDILAQQLVAEAACEPWREDDLFDLFRKGAPYSELDRHDFDEIVEMLSEGIPVGTGKAAAYLHRDRINGVIRGRRGARMTAIQCGGAIPEVADYRVLAEPEGTFVGTLDEDFSIESMAGDIILLGTTSWRIRRIEAGVVRVEDAHGQPPSVPFWLGEAPSRTIELSEEVSRLRQDIGDRLPPTVETPHRYDDDAGVPTDAAFAEDGSVPAQHRGVSNPAPETASLPARPEALVGRAERQHSPQADAIRWLAHECNLPAEAAEQVVRYIRAERDGIGLVPTQQDVVFERFFDESGGMQLVVHAPFGGRINRAWGLALRKRYCVGFDFELQAAASDDAMLLSIGANNSFPLTDMFDLVKPQWVEESVEQSLLISPMFGARWRWNATRALAILRQRQGKKVPPQIQRMRADDLMAAVFPKLVGCQENATGPIEIPDHPIVRQTVYDCMHEAMDIDGLKNVLDRIEAGEIRLHAKDTTEPSPFAHEMLNSKPYTYLDDAPLEERRARAVTLRRSLPENSRDLGALDPDAIERVIDEARPDPRDPEELHEALLTLIAVRAPHSVRPEPSRSEAERRVEGFRPSDSDSSSSIFPLPSSDLASWFDTLVTSGRAAIADTEGGPMWFAAENLPAIRALYPNATIRPELRLPPDLASRTVNEDDARLALFRGHMEISGPVTIAELAQRTSMPPAAAKTVLAQLEGEGSVMRGQFRPNTGNVAAAFGAGSGDEGRPPRGGAGRGDEEFCDRRLLARIHRYTLDRLRQEIEPVTAQDLMRFLLRWQHVAPGTQLEGKRGLLEAATQLQGFDIPAVAWERHILPARVAAYKGSWLDELCMSGDVAWGRLALPKALASVRAEPVEAPRRQTPAKAEFTEAATRLARPISRPATTSSATPISLVRRTDLPWLLAGIRSAGRVPEPVRPEPSRSEAERRVEGLRAPSDSSLLTPNSSVTGAGRDILDLLAARGALFYDDIASASGRLPTDVERGLWDLVARGLITADGFQALRSLMASSKRRNFQRPQRARLFRSLAVGLPSGRWSLLPQGTAFVGGQGPDPARPEALSPVRAEPVEAAEPPRPDLPFIPQTEHLAETWAEQLLFRYGVVFRDLVQRENITVPWRDILRALRRMEARGSVRGGRFVAGFYGEQYARPEAVESLRKVRRMEKKGELVRISAVDPLNLTGTITPGPRVTAVHTRHVLYRDGVPLTDEEAAQVLAESRVAKAG
jgi:ATP-dependent Lhr-like helicase